MTALEVYELTTKGGATDFARLIAACEHFGPYCLIDGLAVNCYVEPVYTVDADWSQSYQIVPSSRTAFGAKASKSRVIRTP